MESLGKSSYSIYLMHGLPIHFFLFFGLDQTDPGYVFTFYWILLIPITIVFYYSAEKPFHYFARKIGFYLNQNDLQSLRDKNGQV